MVGRGISCVCRPPRPGGARLSWGGFPERAGSAPLNSRADEVGTERRRPRTRCKCGFRKVLLLSSREFIFPCLLDSSSWPSRDFFFFFFPSSLPLLEKLASESTLQYLPACSPKVSSELFGSLPPHASAPRAPNLPRELRDSVPCD